jgi:hypothetical protein
LFSFTWTPVFTTWQQLFPWRPAVPGQESVPSSSRRQMRHGNRLGMRAKLRKPLLVAPVAAVTKFSCNETGVDPQVLMIFLRGQTAFSSWLHLTFFCFFFCNLFLGLLPVLVSHFVVSSCHFCHFHICEKKNPPTSHEIVNKKSKSWVRRKKSVA